MKIWFILSPHLTLSLSPLATMFDDVVYVTVTNNLTQVLNLSSQVNVLKVSFYSLSLSLISSLSPLSLLAMAIDDNVGNEESEREKIWRKDGKI